MGLLFPATQVTPVGKAVLQVSDTLPGNPLFALGVTVAVNVAGTPAGTVAAAGAAAMLKSFTMALLLEVANCRPFTLALPLLPNSSDPPGTGGATGVTVIVMVAVAAVFSAPMLHSTVGGEPLGAPHVPWLAVAVPNVAPVAGRKSTNWTPLVKSPLFVMV
jgi:hypothetical protein